MNLRPTQEKAAAEQQANDVVGSLGAPRYEDITVPRTAIPGKMRLVTRAETSAIRAATRKHLIEQGFPADAGGIAAFGAKEEWDEELAARTLAHAIRDPKDPERALCPIEDWRDCDADQIEALYSKYLDYRDRIDPLREEAKLTEVQHAAISAAAKKKDVALLMSYGSPALASFAITSVEPPASSPTLTS